MDPGVNAKFPFMVDSDPHEKFPFVSRRTYTFFEKKNVVYHRLDMLLQQSWVPTWQGWPELHGILSVCRNLELQDLILQDVFDRFQSITRDNDPIQTCASSSSSSTSGQSTAIIEISDRKDGWVEKDIPQEVTTEATHEELDKFLADGAERERESLDSSVLSKKMYSKGKREDFANANTSEESSPMTEEQAHSFTGSPGASSIPEEENLAKRRKST